MYLFHQTQSKVSIALEMKIFCVFSDKDRVGTEFRVVGDRVEDMEEDMVGGMGMDNILYVEEVVVGGTDKGMGQGKDMAL